MILLNMNDLDLILGIDWLAAYHATVDCFIKKVTFSPINQPPFRVHGTKGKIALRKISTFECQKIVKQGL